MHGLLNHIDPKGLVSPERGTGVEPATMHVEYAQQMTVWKVLDDIIEGTKRLRDQAEQYVPRAVRESSVNYAARIKLAEFYNMYEKALKALTGLVFRRPVVVGDDMPEILKQLAEDVDLQGNNLYTFSRRLFLHGLHKGHAGILVDYPSVPPGMVRTMKHEQELGLRPYWTMYRADQILNYRLRRWANGTVGFSLLVLVDEVWKDLGAYGGRFVKQLRVFEKEGLEAPVTLRLLQQVSGKEDEWVDIQSPITYPAHIPQVPFVPLALGEIVRWPFHTRPPLQDLAYANIAHFNVLTDHRWALHCSSIPILVTTGMGEDDAPTNVTNSASIGWNLPAGADAKYIELTGKSIGETRQELKDIEQRCSTLGAVSMLQQETRAAETAASKELDRTESDSILAMSAQHLQDALEQAYVITGQYLRIDPESAGSIQVNVDYQDLNISPEEIRLYSDLHVRGQISDELFLRMLEDGNALPEDFSLKAELAAMMGARVDAALAAQMAADEEAATAGEEGAEVPA